MSARYRYSLQSPSIWPGYVDALSALLMVVIFVLLIFTFSQFILSYILSGQNTELQSLHASIASITEMLGLERNRNAQMGKQIASLSSQVEILTLEQTKLQVEVDDLTARNKTQKDEKERQLLTIASLQQDINALQTLRRELEQKIAETAAGLEREQQLSMSLRDRSKTLEASLAEEQEKTLLAQQNIEQRDIRIQALSALIGEQQQSLDKEQHLKADARAEVALLKEQLAQLHSQLEEISNALTVSEATRNKQQEKIRDLGDRLNVELARKVNELERYRSDFFGRLRKIIGDNPVIRIEGDRSLLQAELLFPSGTAKLGKQGKVQLRQVAAVLLQMIPSIPGDLPWILRVDGHTDRVPIHSQKFASNWELSMARAVSVVRYLAEQGIPEERMVAAGFSKFHPIDPADTVEAYTKNRRIEIKLTSR
ncbi:MAG: OmpA family protein [Desulfobulbaceae bacterium]|nr:OmpA family protein [Desulfobulbaceae bacterium]